MNLNAMIMPAVVICGVAALVVVLILLGKAMYKKAPPNTAMVVTGPKGSKTIIGKGCFVIPVFERVDYLSLANMQSDFTSRDEIPTKDAINILVDAVANFSVSTDPTILPKAASKFLGRSTNEIEDIVRPVLEGNIREIISQTTLKELIQGDKKVFAERVIENVTPNLRDMGLELTTFNIQNFKDKNGVIENLGIQNTVQISKDAAISKANAEREIAVAQAEADKAANEARVASNLEIAKKQNELAIQKAELKKVSDIKQAEADAAYKIQEQEQQKTIEITTANAKLANLQKETELKDQEVAIQEKTLDIKVKKAADADKYAAQQNADAHLYEQQRNSEAELFARQKRAEADKFEAEQKAAALKAESEAKKVAMENEAAGIRARGEAEAAAIQAKAIAEAEGILKKAEAMKQYGDAAKQQMQLDVLKAYFEQLPAIAEAVAKPMSQIDSITMYGEGDAAKLTENVTKTIKQITDGITDSTGLNPSTLLKGAFGKTVTGSDKAV